MESECGRFARKSPLKNYACMRKGIGVGSHINLSPGYHPDNTEGENIYCGVSRNSRNASPYQCFKKGFKIGKNIQYGKKQYRYRENFDFGVDTDGVDMSAIYTILIAVVIGLVTFGIVISLNMHWFWSILVGFTASMLFLYFCNCD